MRFFSIIASMMALSQAVCLEDADNKAGNPLCDQEKEIETPSDRKWKRLKKAFKINKVTRAENKRRQERDTRKERESQLKARAAARALQRHADEQERRK